MKTNKKEKRKQIQVNYWLIWGMSSTGILKVNRFLSREEKLWTRLPPINKLLPKSKCYQHLVYFSFKILDLRSTSIKQSTIVFDMFSDSEALIYPWAGIGFAYSMSLASFVDLSSDAYVREPSPSAVCKIDSFIG